MASCDCEGLKNCKNCPNNLIDTTSKRKTAYETDSRTGYKAFKI
jgi:hypothetical protein